MEHPPESLTRLPPALCGRGDNASSRRRSGNGVRGIGLLRSRVKGLLRGLGAAL